MYGLICAKLVSGDLIYLKQPVYRKVETKW